MTTAIAESFSADSLDLETLLELSRRTDPSVSCPSTSMHARERSARHPSTSRTASLSWSDESPATGRRNGHEPCARASLDSGPRSTGSPTRRSRPGTHPVRRDQRWLADDASRLSYPFQTGWCSTAPVHPPLARAPRRRALQPAWCWRRARKARLLEWRLGELTPLREMQAEVAEPRHERSGPVGSRPASRYGTPTGEQRNARERDQAARFIERVAAAASRLAHERGWERILVSGGEQHTDSLVDGAAARAARDGAARSSRAGAARPRDPRGHRHRAGSCGPRRVRAAG